LKTDAGLERLLGVWMVVGRPDEDRVRAIQLIALAEKRNLVSYLGAVAKNDREPLPIRRAAVESMAAFKSKYVVDSLAALIDDRRLRVAAVAALGTVQTPEALGVLQQAITGRNVPADVQSAALA